MVGVNNAYEVAPWLDILYGCDKQWWDWHKGVPSFIGTKVTMCPKAAEHYGLWLLHQGEPGPGLSTDPTVLNTGYNGGFQAINLAYHLGASKVLLIGYDMAFSRSGAAHWFGDHPNGVRSTYTRFIAMMNTIAEQGLIEVINCSVQTALRCFPRMSIEEALA